MRDIVIDRDDNKLKVIGFRKFREEWDLGLIGSINCLFRRGWKLFIEFFDDLD